MNTDSSLPVLRRRSHRLAAGLLCFLLPLCAWAGPVSGVTAQQRFPWNGLVDVTFRLDAAAVLTISAVDTSTGTALPVNTLTAEGREFRNGETSLDAGECRIVWDAGADVPGAVYENVEVSVSVDEDLYMVVDLTKKVNGKFPISYLSGPPAGGWPLEYKTKKLVLRKIKAGTFLMGSPTSEWGRVTNENQHQVTLTKDFYIGIYEVTEGQAWLVDRAACTNYLYGTRSCLSPEFPVQIFQLSSANTKPFPSVFENLLSNSTGISFSLPTEAQWEYACRAGTTSALYTGTNPESIQDLVLDLNGREVFGRVLGNELEEPAAVFVLRGTNDSACTAVGLFKPNPWGLYDMYGNLRELCKDTYVASLGGPVTDPCITGGRNPVMKGGCVGYTLNAPRSATRAEFVGNSVYCGFRVVAMPQ